MAAGTIGPCAEDRGHRSDDEIRRPRQVRRRLPLIELMLLVASIAVCAAFVLDWLG